MTSYPEYPPPYPVYPPVGGMPPQPSLNPYYSYGNEPRAPPMENYQGGGYPQPQPTPYPMPQAQSYPPASQGGYPQPSQGYPPSSQGGYPPSSQGGYPPSSQGGYPPSSQGGSYPPGSQGGYPPSSQGGYPPQGYPPPGVQICPQAPAGYPGPGGYQQPAPGGYPPPGGAGAPQPISTQPTFSSGGWMSGPAPKPNCPPGLEYLTTLDQLLIKQKVEILEVITGFETQNKYTIKNSMGQKVFLAAEDSSCCGRCFCGTNRPLDLKILDNFKNEVIHMYRPLAAQSCFFPCCLQSIEVYSPPGHLAGTVQQEWTIFSPKFSVRDATGNTVLYIEGPMCTYSICGDVEFQVLSLTGQVVGKISKQWSGLLREMFTDSDYFGVTFPGDLDVRMKATMLAACFLIDYMFFEKIGNREEDGFGMC